MLNALREDVGALSGDLRTINGKIEKIMSLLSDVGRGQNHVASSSAKLGAAVGGGGDGSGFQSGNVVGSAAPPVAVVHGGRVMFEGWIGGGRRESDDGIHRGGEDPGVCGAPAGYFVGQFFPKDHQQQGAGTRHPFNLRPPQTPPSRQRYPVGSDQVGEEVHFVGGNDGLNTVASIFAVKTPVVSTIINLWLSVSMIPLAQAPSPTKFSRMRACV